MFPPPPKARHSCSVVLLPRTSPSSSRNHRSQEGFQGHIHGLARSPCPTHRRRQSMADLAADPVLRERDTSRIVWMQLSQKARCPRIVSTVERSILLLGGKLTRVWRMAHLLESNYRLTRPVPISLRTKW